MQLVDISAPFCQGVRPQGSANSDSLIQIIGKKVEGGTIRVSKMSVPAAGRISAYRVL